MLVNNVGREFYKEFVDVATADFDRQIAINLRSVFLCCAQVVPLMIRQKRGSIINTAFGSPTNSPGAVSDSCFPPSSPQSCSG